MAMMYMDSKFEKYKQTVVQLAKELNIAEPYKGPVYIEAKFFMGTRRRKDLPNAGKLEYDALNGIIYEDDSQIFKLETEKFYDKENPRAEIKVYRYPEAQWA